ncbi:hypothetical protein DPMN_012282 [Dreissena polymorpha]|uniref:Uncharacterized protein n=1 Tax=Dreissena polymorpha TaxID=45954 RepID=A0A9D4N5P1_DREPO|nr:hypothetical protein DPMN_012282 [Dreissena polymorpha]
MPAFTGAPTGQHRRQTGLPYLPGSEWARCRTGCSQCRPRFSRCRAGLARSFPEVSNISILSRWSPCPRFIPVEPRFIPIEPRFIPVDPGSRNRAPPAS